jgi:hypothetical protein
MTDTAETPGTAIDSAKTASETAERATHPFSDAEVGSMRTAEQVLPDALVPYSSTDGDWLLVADAALALGVSGDTVKRRLKLGRLEGRKDHAGRWQVLVRAMEHRHPHDGLELATELAVLHARVVDLEREREQLIADREAWREQARRSDVHLQHLMARLPKPHGATPSEEAAESERH